MLAEPQSARQCTLRKSREPCSGRPKRALYGGRAEPLEDASDKSKESLSAFSGARQER